MIDLPAKLRAVAEATGPNEAREIALAAADTLDDMRGWKTVALANQATAQSHQARWASAEALLMMALPHVETEGDESLAHEIRRHLNADTMEPSE